MRRAREIEERTHAQLRRTARCGGLLAFVIPYPRRFRLALKLAPLGRPFIPLLERDWAQGGGGDDRACAHAVPSCAKPRFGGAGRRGDARRAARARDPADGVRAAGAAAGHQRRDHPAARPARRRRRGRERGRMLRSARPAHGATRTTRSDQARRNVDVWSKEIGRGEIDAIIVNASGCGTTVKDYGHMLRDDPVYAPIAAERSRALPRTCRSSSMTTSSARRSAGRRCASPIIRRARCSTASGSTTSRRRC